MRKWLKESEGKMPPAETSLGTQELHQRRQQIQVGRESWNYTGTVGSWCGNAGMWSKSWEAESWELFYGFRNPGLPSACCCDAALVSLPSPACSGQDW